MTSLEREQENMLLLAARNGKVEEVKDLIQARNEGCLNFSLNVKGMYISYVQAIII